MAKRHADHTRANVAHDLAVTSLRGVGPRIAERLYALGIHRVHDLLFHLPKRYQDRTRIRTIAELPVGSEGLLEAWIERTQVHYGGRRTLLVTALDADDVTIRMRFFHFSRAQTQLLTPGARVIAFGELRTNAGTAEMVHPEYRIISADQQLNLSEHLTPVYPLTEGLGQTTLRRLIEQVLDNDVGSFALEDFVPSQLLDDLNLPTLASALRDVHKPKRSSASTTIQDVYSAPAFKRLAFEELLAHHLSLRMLRRRLDETKSPAMPLARGKLSHAFEHALQFKLTDAQDRARCDIESDLAKTRPMHRLVQGDVGSGKTVVAALAALRAIENGYQVALMAPTELLAEQHLSTLSAWLNPLGVEVAWLAGSLSAPVRRQTLARIANGQAVVTVGTHALFQDDVHFSRLGLAVVDEHHRFGVAQRLALREKGAVHGFAPHQLIMSATPIPRTLAMTAYADLDNSTIDELPPGRKPVVTAAVSAARRDEVVCRVSEAVNEGQQVYWVCTLIDESENLEAQAAANTHEALSGALPNRKIGLLHGRMKPEQKDTVMSAFKNGDVAVLVATTVVEVGVDVPNATLMVIENAERLGLAQLHQLRGRVGRGSKRSSCVLLYEAPLSRTARARLKVMRKSNDGFEIARRDLELRGPGEVLGTRQTGAVAFRIADLSRDVDILDALPSAAEQMLKLPDKTLESLSRRWLGQLVQYGDV